MEQKMGNVFDLQFIVIFIVSAILLVIAAIWLRRVISNDLGDIVYKQYQNMFDKIDLYIEKFKELDSKVRELKEKYNGLADRAFQNKDGIDRIEKKLDEMSKPR